MTTRTRLYPVERYALSGIFVTVFLFLLLLSLYSPGWLQPLVSAVSDPFYRFGPKIPSEKIVFVAVDHAAVKTLGRWPWPRDRLADGLKRLSGSRVVVLDMVFSETTDQASDAHLATVLSGLPNVGGFLLNGSRSMPPSELGMSVLAQSALLGLNPSGWIQSSVAEIPVPPILNGHTALGALNTLPDADARFRHYPAGFVYGGMVQPSLGLMALQMGLNIPARSESGHPAILHLGTHRIPLDKRGFTRLNYYPEDAFKTLSFADLLKPGFNPQQVKDRLVIVGITEAGVTDLRATPLGQYPGPLMHATFLANSLDDVSLKEASVWVMAMGLLALLAAVALAMRMALIWQRVIWYLFMAGLAWGSALLLYQHENLWLEPAYLLAALLIAAPGLELTLLAHSRRHTEKLRLAFSSCLPPGIVNRIVEDPDRLALDGVRKPISVLFSDIRGFTARSEHMEPEQLAELMTLYFDPMTEAVFSAGGTLDKYIGDAIMALFNAPLDQPNHALRACHAAIAMQYAQRRINATLAERGLPPLKTGVGINSGVAIVGNLGSTLRFNYTAIGDVVNMASRFESATKALGVDIVIGAPVYAEVKDSLPCRDLGMVNIPGKEQPQQVYALLWNEVVDPQLV